MLKEYSPFNPPLPLGGPPSSFNSYTNSGRIRIIFEKKDNKNEEDKTQTIIYTDINMKIFQLIELYNKRTNDFSGNKFFFFRNKMLNLVHTVNEARLYDGCKISVSYSNKI